MFGADLSLQFRVFGIQVQVSLFFLVLAVIIGQSGAKGSPLLLAAWVVVVFGSVLLHELGHALSARAFGQQPAITLYGLGGVTTWRPRGEMSPGRAFLVALAGPLIGIVIGVAALLAYFALPEKDTTAARVVFYLVWANLGWGILNLIPMLPLDGGKIMVAVFDLLAPGRGQRAACYASIVTAVLVAPLAIAIGLFMLAFYCAFAIWMNIQALRIPPPQPPSAAVIDVTAQVLPPDEPPARGDRLP